MILQTVRDVCLFREIMPERSVRGESSEPRGFSPRELAPAKATHDGWLSVPSDP